MRWATLGSMWSSYSETVSWPRERRGRCTWGTSLKTRYAQAWQVLELLSEELDSQGSNFHSYGSLRKYDKVTSLSGPWFPRLSSGAVLTVRGSADLPTVIPNKSQALHKRMEFALSQKLLPSNNVSWEVLSNVGHQEPRAIFTELHEKGLSVKLTMFQMFNSNRQPLVIILDSVSTEPSICKTSCQTVLGRGRTVHKDCWAYCPPTLRRSTSATTA